MRLLIKIAIVSKFENNEKIRKNQKMEVAPINLPTPYDYILLQYGDHVLQVIQDILSCKVEAIRNTHVHDMEPLLNLFRGTTLSKKRDALMEFLSIMPEYKTTDQELLYERLKRLKEQIKHEGNQSDLLLWALWKYRRTAQSENEA